MIALNLNDIRTLERYNQQNFLLNIIWMTTFESFYLKRYFVNKLLVDDTKKRFVEGKRYNA